MDADPKKLVNVEEAKLEAYDPVVSQNSRGELYFNPLAMARLDQTVVTPTEAIGYEVLSSSEIAIHFVEPGTDAAVSFKRPSNKRTGRCSFGAILAMKPLFKVPKGRLTLYPFRIDRLADDSTRFVLLLEQGESVLTRSYQRRPKRLPAGTRA
jgi:hypothetical protein